MKGMFQTLVQRAISSGLYFPLEDICRIQAGNLFPSLESYRSFHNFVAGTLAGTINGIVMNPAVTVRVSDAFYNISTNSMSPITMY